MELQNSLLKFQLNNIPFTWSTEIVTEVKQKLEPVISNTELSSAVSKIGIVQEWKKILDDNARLPIESVSYQVQFCQFIQEMHHYHIINNIQYFKLLQAKVQTWYENGWMKNVSAEY